MGMKKHKPLYLGASIILVNQEQPRNNGLKGTIIKHRKILFIKKEPQYNSILTEEDTWVVRFDKSMSRTPLSSCLRIERDGFIVLKKGTPKVITIHSETNYSVQD